MERAILSVVHQYRTVIKFNFSPIGSHHVIKGHVISFDHNAPQVVSKLFDKTDICKSIKVIFVGPKEQMVNRLYANIEVLLLEEVENLIQECNSTIIDEAGKVDEVACIHNDDIRDDDVARVRQNETQDQDNDIQFHRRFVTSIDPYGTGVTEAEHIILIASNNAFNVALQNNANKI
eukprot:2513650-Ditylum_brightwellii.AAC.1